MTAHRVARSSPIPHLRTAVRDIATVAGWAGMVGAGLWLGHGPLGEALATPGLTDLGAWPAWLAAEPPDVATFAVLRLVVVAVTWWVAGATAVALVARLAGWGGLASLAEGLAPGVARRTTSVLLGALLAGSGVTALPVADPGGTVSVAEGNAGVDRLPPVPPVDVGSELRVLANLPDPRLPGVTRAVPAPTSAGNLAPDTGPAGPEPSPVSAQATQEVGTIGSDGIGSTTPPGPDAVHPVLSPAPAAPSQSSWVVRPGDHLWAIAERTVRDRGGSTDDVASYWRRLVDVNRAGLVDPANPDLIVPGQVVLLPAGGAP